MKEFILTYNSLFLFYLYWTFSRFQFMKRKGKGFFFSSFLLGFYYLYVFATNCFLSVFLLKILEINASHKTEVKIVKFTFDFPNIFHETLPNYKFWKFLRKLKKKFKHYLKLNECEFWIRSDRKFQKYQFWVRSDESFEFNIKDIKWFKSAYHDCWDKNHKKQN